MQKPSRESVIAAYNALVQERGGVPVGAGIFMRETDIPRYCWQGGFWRSWSAFQAEAGHSPNVPAQRIPDDVLLECFAALALELNAVPTEADLALKRKRDQSFPGKMAFRRWGRSRSCSQSFVRHGLAARFTWKLTTIRLVAFRSVSA